MFTNDSYYISPHFFPNNNRSTLSPFYPSSPSSNASGADENNNNHLDDLGRSRPSSVVSDYPSPAIPSSPQPTFDPSPRLNVNVVKDYPYAEVEYCTSSPKSFACLWASIPSSTPYAKWPTDSTRVWTAISPRCSKSPLPVQLISQFQLATTWMRVGFLSLENFAS